MTWSSSQGSLVSERYEDREDEMDGLCCRVGFGAVIDAEGVLCLIICFHNCCSFILKIYVDVKNAK